MDQETLVARLFFRAAFPVMKVPLQEDPALSSAKGLADATVAFVADDVSACLRFEEGSLFVSEELSVSEESCSDADVVLRFSGLKAMNRLLRGGIALPRIRGGLRHPSTILATLRLLMRLKLMLPSQRPKDPFRQYLKVKMSLYMVTTALSVLNKLGDPELQAWTSGQPDRIYQFTVGSPDRDDHIAAYLRVKNGRTKAGRGVYERRRPFVHFRFTGVEEAMKVLLKEVAFVESVELGYVTVEGSPEYSAGLNDLMTRVQSLMT